MRQAGLAAMLRPAVAIISLAAIGTALYAASTSPLLAWRDPVYIVAGFMGVVALALLLLQPLLITGVVPGFSVSRSRHVHRWIGAAIVVCVVLHVAGLWITSPPDVIDALLFASPTLFSLWGVLAMWAVFLSAGLAIFRRRLRWRVWRTAHVVLSLIVVAGTIAHAIPIEGTMGQVSKLVLCVLTALASVAAVRTKHRVLSDVHGG
jgi:predicted ferric reductase